jgi:ABC-type sugar transport system ATPase subunit
MKMAPERGRQTFWNVTAPSTVVSSKNPSNFQPCGASELFEKSWSKSRNRRVVPLALTITGLSKTYPNGVKALKNLSLTIGNLMFGLLGPNGAGKSSLMRTVATLQDPDAGSIDLDGLNVLTQKDEVRKILGYLPQEFGVYPKISAIDLLQHLAVMKGVVNKTSASRWSTAS